MVERSQRTTDTARGAAVATAPAEDRQLGNHHTCGPGDAINICADTRHGDACADARDGTLDPHG